MPGAAMFGPHPQGIGLIVNCDAAVCPRSSTATCSAWNCKGEIHGASVCHFGVADPFTGEARVAVQALKFCEDQAYRQVIIEGDLANVISVINGDDAIVDWRPGDHCRGKNQVWLLPFLAVQECLEKL